MSKEMEPSSSKIDRCESSSEDDDFVLELSGSDSDSDFDEVC